MIAAIRKQFEGRLGKVDVSSLRSQFLAWWNGMERPVLVLDQVAPPEEGAPRAKAPVRQPTEEEIFGLRMMIAQNLWGDGYLGPCAGHFFEELISQLGLTKEHSACVVGAGLGGSARCLTKETGTWVTAYEANPKVVAMAREQCAIAGLAKRVTFEEFDPASTIFSKAKFHAVLSFDTLFTVEDKKSLLAHMVEGLAADGTLMITDYVVPHAPEGNKVLNWFDPAWGGIHLATAAEYEEIFKDLPVDLRVKKDITSEYAELLKSALPKWKGLISLAKDEEVEGVARAAYARFLAKEAMMWAMRLDAILKGELQVHRFIAIKS